MTAAAIVTPRPSLIDRLLNWWFALPSDAANPDLTSAIRRELQEDLRVGLQIASIHHPSALSAEYAQYLIDRHSGHMGERG